MRAWLGEKGFSLARPPIFSGGRETSPAYKQIGSNEPLYGDAMNSTPPRRYALAAVLVLCALLVYSYLGAADDATPAQQELENQFQESMMGVVLKGHFTLNGREGLREETYTVEKVTKMPGDYWLFHARIQYGGKDVTVPVPVRLLWAGDTPVVSLTDATIPGLGTFTARVLFYNDEYIGTWSSGTHGGQQFGRIVKIGSETP